MEQMQVKEMPNGTWIPFYMEMADKLLGFKDNRKLLLDIANVTLEESVIHIIHHWY